MVFTVLDTANIKSIDTRLRKLEHLTFILGDKHNTIAVRDNNTAPLILDQYGTGDNFQVKQGGTVVFTIADGNLVLKAGKKLIFDGA